MSPDRARAALAGVAVGDTLGARFEGRTGPFDPDLDGLSGPLRYTDDTHMTIGLAEHLVEQGGLVEAELTAHFARRFSQEPWRGYGPGPPRVFAQVERGLPWEEASRSMYGGEGSFGNGGAMRAAPVGIWAARDPALAAGLGRRQAAVTHAHVLGKEGAALIAAGVSLALEFYGPAAFLEGLRSVLESGAYEEALERVEVLLPDPDPAEVVEMLGNGIEAVRSVPTATCAFLASEDFREAVSFAIGLGGDTDTIAAMAGALAGARDGLSGIPGEWMEMTEGTDRLIDLADRLAGAAREV